jgi:hypothetical protein
VDMEGKGGQKDTDARGTYELQYLLERRLRCEGCFVLLCSMEYVQYDSKDNQPDNTHKRIPHPPAIMTPLASLCSTCLEFDPFTCTVTSQTHTSHWIGGVPSIFTSSMHDKGVVN